MMQNLKTFNPQQQQQVESKLLNEKFQTENQSFYNHCSSTSYRKITSLVVCACIGIQDHSRIQRKWQERSY
jgi:hypothetical protein